jgi:hypothetical protein
MRTSGGSRIWRAGGVREAVRRVKVILAALVNDAEAAFPGGCRIGEDFVNLPGLQVLRVAGADADYEIRIRRGLAHGQPILNEFDGHAAADDSSGAPEEIAPYNGV